MACDAAISLASSMPGIPTPPGTILAGQIADQLVQTTRIGRIPVVYWSHGSAVGLGRGTCSSSLNDWPQARALPCLPHPLACNEDIAILLFLRSGRNTRILRCRIQWGCITAQCVLKDGTDQVRMHFLESDSGSSFHPRTWGIGARRRTGAHRRPKDCRARWVRGEGPLRPRDPPGPCMHRMWMLATHPTAVKFPVSFLTHLHTA